MSKMKKLLIILIYLSFSSFFYSQQITNPEFIATPKKHILLKQSDLISVPLELENKILSGKLIQNISEKKFLYEEGLLLIEEATEQVVIYVAEYPSAEQIASLELLNIDCYLDIWTSPLPNHPYGFFIAEIPVDKFIETLSLGFIKKVDTAEYENFPHNNAGVIAINADDVWTAGYDGTGVKVAVLDSGIDTYYDGTEFPSTFTRKDYSSYPILDDNVENTVTGHGTHVAGSVLARGTNSIGRSDEGNGATPFKGSAPDADLIFLKIGSDATSSASSTAMIGAMDGAVNVYNADVLSMSYGGWYIYHDGSSSVEQKVDWVYSQGKPFFLSAGNSADDDHHYSGTVPAGSETGYIAINSNNGSALTFNLVWYDGLGTNNNLYMEYYGPSPTYTLLAKSESVTTESVRGTESKFSNHTSTVLPRTYYVKVFNTSGNSQFFHIYFDDWGYPDITFASPDPEYTIGQPASADNGFAVGSYVTRYSWIASDGTGPWAYSGFTLNGIAPYSSRGPRVNGGVQKPNITAPGSAIISIRDTDVYTSANLFWIDNDGTTGSGSANYYVMTGTSMACPIAAGAGALLLDKEPTATPQLIYDAIQNSASTSGTGTVPNSTWGYGKFDVLAASNEPLPVELSSFIAKSSKDGVHLDWVTETEVNNYGFEIQRSQMNPNSEIQNPQFQLIGFIEGHGNSNSPKEYNFLDEGISYGNYVYRLKQIDNDGTFEYSDVIEVNAGIIPEGFVLEQNYPNPFNPSTVIKFALSESQQVTLTVYDILGNEITQLFNETAEAGKIYEIEFNASYLSSGVYYYRLITPQKSLVRKMLLLR